VFDTENVLNGLKNCFAIKFVTSWGGGGGILLCGDILKGQRVMLIKWEDLALFCPDCLDGKTS
jgi:hypothetical protein